MNRFKVVPDMREGYPRFYIVDTLKANQDLDLNPYHYHKGAADRHCAMLNGECGK